MRLAWKICVIRSEFGVCSADLWKDPIHTPLNLLLLGRAGLVPQGISAPGITWVPSVAGGVPDGDGQRFGTGRRCRNLPTLGAAQCPSVLPGTGTVVFIYFFFPIDIVSLQSFYWEISAIKKGKKKRGIFKFSRLKQEQFLVVWLLRLQLCDGGCSHGTETFWSVLGVPQSALGSSREPLMVLDLSWWLLPGDLPITSGTLAVIWLVFTLQ